MVTEYALTAQFISTDKLFESWTCGLNITASLQGNVFEIFFFAKKT